MKTKKQAKAKSTSIPSGVVSTAKDFGIQSDKNWYRWWQIGLAVLAAVLYVNTLGHQYTFDDSIVIVENAFTKRGFGGLYELFTRDFFEGIYGPQGMELTGGRYRPLSLMMFAIEWQFFPNTPMVGHLLNVFFYMLTAWVMLGVLTRWFGRGSMVPYATVLLFVVHPVHTEVVANIKSRDEIMCLLLLLSALYSVQQKKAIWAIWGSVAFFMSLLAKETSFMYAPLIPMVYLVFDEKEGAVLSNRLGAALRKSLPYFVAALAYFTLRYAMVGGVGGSETNPDIMENPFVSATVSEKLGTIGLILFRYLGLMVFPITLSCDYSYPQIPFVGLANPLSLLTWVAVIGATGWSLVHLLRKSVIALGWLMFLLPLLLVSNLPFNIGAPMGERFLYVPSLGFLLMAVLLLTRVLSAQKKILWAIVVVIAVIFSLKAVNRNPFWHDNLTLFGEDVKNSPNSAKIHYYYGSDLLNSVINGGDNRILDKALPELTRAVSLNPKFHLAIYALAKLYDMKGDGKNSLDCCTQVLALKPTHIGTTLLLGKIYGKYFNNPDKSIEYLERYVFQFKQNTDPTGWQYLGTAYAIKGRIPEAISALNSCLKLQPDNADAYTNLGYLYLQVGNTEQGNASFEKAKALRKR